MQFKKTKRVDPRMDITPLIDVVLLLVIFFMLTTTFVGAPAIKVNLPKSSAREIAKERKEVKVTITKDGKLYVDRETGGPISLKELRKVLNKVARENRDTMVIIRADENTIHGNVVAVMDVAKNAGLNRLAIATKLGKRGRR
ncbi:MAG: biopolymer transporter ExbD [Deltaproteobacteria bacterium]|nr:biopolymer transporter ExbD [Deltaproteobacteria bacterium]MBW2121785.1 biopolymer transporter ExbD [Deltaproteobacteria bacterium]